MKNINEEHPPYREKWLSANWLRGSALQRSQRVQGGAGFPESF
jgi:hypothetical protein